MKYLHYDRQTKVCLDTAKEAREQLIAIGRDWIETEQLNNKSMEMSEWKVVETNLAKLDDHSRGLFEGPVRQSKSQSVFSPVPHNSCSCQYWLMSQSTSVRIQ